MRDLAFNELTDEDIGVWRELQRRSTDTICSVRIFNVRANIRALRKAGVIRQIGYVKGTAYFKLQRRYFASHTRDRRHYDGQQGHKYNSDRRRRAFLENARNKSCRQQSHN